jgi:hypothetical protein
MSKFLDATQVLVEKLKSSILPVNQSLPFDYSKMLDDTKLPTYINVGNLIGKDGNNYPALLPLKLIKGIAFEINESNREEIHLAIQHYILQISEASKEGYVNISAIDTKKIGSNFRSLRRLGKNLLSHFVADEENIKNVLDDHHKQSVSIINECLTNHESIAIYNEKSGHIQPYRILAIADFPHGFNNFDRLESLLQNADETGVFVFLSYDTSMLNNLSKTNQDKFSQILSHLLCLEEFGNPENDFYRESGYNSVIITPKTINIPSEIFNTLKESSYYRLGSRYYATSQAIDMYNNIKGSIHFRINPDARLEKIMESTWHTFNNYILQLDRRYITLENINKQITQLTPSLVMESDQVDGLRIPIGKVGGQTHYFTIGYESDNFHAIIGGQSGKGKTVLLNNIIARGIEAYSPDELRFVIIDCGGTGFQEFDNCNSIQLMCRSSNVETCLKAVEFIEQELARRETLFNLNKVSDLKQYINTTGEVLPRLLCLIDEFHVLYTGKDKYSSYFDTVLVDRVIRIGRKFGIHLVTCTQSLGGGVRRSILDNIPLRIALGMTTDQSNGFLGLKNDAAANLDRGIAIYNAQNGNPSANKIVKVNYISSEDIERIISLSSLHSKNYQLVEKIKIQHHGL